MSRGEAASALYGASSGPRSASRGATDLEALSHLLDTRFRLPVLGWRYGLDGLLGLVPVLGDTVSASISAYLIVRAVQAGVPRSLAARMGLNVALDTLVGSIPLLGNVFDFAFKANTRNLRLLREWEAARRGGLDEVAERR